MELLFESRLNLKLFGGQLRFVQHRPTIHPEPVVRPDSPSDGKGAAIYGSVHRDGGMLRMWYQAWPADWEFKSDSAAVAYAESDDGIHWRKPPLKQVKNSGGPSNLLSLAMHCPSVFIDPASAPSHRYRATGCAYPGLFMALPQVKRHGYYTAHSADGLHWEFDSHEPTWNGHDVITSIHHPWHRRAIIAMKFRPRVGRVFRRCIHTAEMKDGVYSPHSSALYPDESDDAMAVTRGFHSGDYYGMGMQAAGSGTVGFLWNFWHTLPYVMQGQGMHGATDITLVYQPDPAGRWMHVQGRPIFLDRTEHAWTSGGIYSASCPVEVGDEHWLYFAGLPCVHGTQEVMDKWKQQADNHLSDIGFARWPKWRLFGFVAEPEGWIDIDLGELTEPCELWLNFSSPAHGRVRAAVKDDDTRGLDQCHDLDGDSTAQKVVWKNGSILPARPGKNTMVRLSLEYATAYAYEVRAVR